MNLNKLIDKQIAKKTKNIQTKTRTYGNTEHKGGH